MNCNSVVKIYKDGLCCSCGVCVGVCPVGAITYEYNMDGFIIPKVSNECVNCGKCVNCCPGRCYYVEDRSYKTNYYTLYSNDTVIRNDASSGGFVTELLCYLVSKHYVDYCVVIPTVKDDLRVIPMVTDDIEVIRNAKGSKYITVEYGAILDRIKSSDKKYAMVVLPCQEYAIKNYLNQSTSRVIYITLMCNHVSGTAATKYLLNKNNISEKKFEIKYRGGGWPGNMSINDKAIGRFRNIYLNDFGNLFFNIRCKMCDNHFGKNSSITVGDPYYLIDERQGASFCIVREESYQNIIDEMLDDNIISEKVIKLKKSDIYNAYKGIFISEDNINIYLKIRKLMLKKNPVGIPITMNGKSASIKNWYMVLKIYLNKIVGHIKIYRITRRTK